MAPQAETIVYREPSYTPPPPSYPGLPSQLLITCTGPLPSSPLPRACAELVATYAGGAHQAAVLDLRGASASAIEAAVAGKGAVLHVGAPPCEASPAEWAAFAKATEALLTAASSAKVQAFVFASSTSVAFVGEDLRGAPDDAPAAPSPADAAAAALAPLERRVATASGAHGMPTTVLRMAPVYGAGDSELLPGIAAAAREGRAALISSGNNVVDFVFAGNAAHAALLAAAALAKGGSGAEGVAGATLAITDGEPVPYRTFVEEVQKGLGYGGAPASLAYPIALLLSLILAALSALLAPLAPHWRPRLTPARVRALARHRYFSGARAAASLGYKAPWPRAAAVAAALHAAPAALRNPAARVRYEGPFSAAEVARHTAPEDAWIIVDGKVYAISAYLEQHPGGDAILNNAGGDSSAGFHGPQHPAQAAEVLEEFYIGDLKK